MPEFILSHGSAEAEQAFNGLDAFTRGYIEAAFFTETGNLENGDLEQADTSEIAPSALAAIIADCSAWHAKAAKLLALAYDCDDYEAEQAGRDYWFMRNGHGVGFWDRRQLEKPLYHDSDGFFLGPEDDETAERLGTGRKWLGSLGEALSKLAWKAGGVDMYRGDDGLIYFS
jgi:hypothetical protein